MGWMDGWMDGWMMMMTTEDAHVSFHHGAPQGTATSELLQASRRQLIGQDAT
jgi:hypothetical protein